MVVDAEFKISEPGSNSITNIINPFIPKGYGLNNRVRGERDLWKPLRYLSQESHCKS